MARFKLLVFSALILGVILFRHSTPDVGNAIISGDCIVFDMSAWTQEQKNLLQATVYKLAADLGEDTPPVVDYTEGKVCWENPSINIRLITQKSVETKYAEIDNEIKRKDYRPLLGEALRKENAKEQLSPEELSVLKDYRGK